MYLNFIKKLLLKRYHNSRNNKVASAQNKPTNNNTKCRKLYILEVNNFHSITFLLLGHLPWN